MNARISGALLCAALALWSEQGSSAPKRALPDYGNRGKEPTTAGDVALWVPRVILSPLYLVTEYGIRWPLGKAISAAERANVPELVYDFFFFGPNHSAGFAPIGFVDFGFRPSVGLYAFWDDAGFKGHDLRFHGTTGGSGWFAGVVTERARFHQDDALTLTLSGVTRPDRAFFGVGPDTLQSNISRFGEKRFDASLAADFRLWRASRVETSLGVRSLDFRRGYWDDDPATQDRVAAGVFSQPDGLAEGYTAQTSGLRIAFDNRQPSPADGSGVRLELEAEQGTDIRRSPGAAWLRYSATAGAFVDLNGRNRVLSVSLATLFVDSLNQRAIPFTELVQLGGPGPMRGFFPGRLRDNSAAVVTLKYRWPIWVWLDGSLQAAVGNVFGDHLQQLEWSRFRFSSAIGLESIGSRDSSFELLAGIGTETFGQGAEVTSVRVLLGSNRGF